MDHLMLESDVEVPTVEVDALGVHVVEDGDVMEAERHRSYPADCFCQDGRHRAIDHEEVEYENSYIRDGAHRITVHLYSVTSTENDMTPDDLEAPMPSQATSEAAIAKDAEHARRNVARRFPDDPKTGKGFWSLLGIGKDGKK